MKKILRFILSMLCTMCIMGTTVYADTVTLPDGTVLNNSTDWSSLPSSYDGLEYYDVLVPYAKKISEIGGHAISGKDGTVYATSNYMSDELLSNKVGDHVTLESPIGGNSTNVGGTNISVISDNGLSIGVDEWGNKYYFIALGHYFYPSEAVNSGFYPFSDSNRGQLVDVVFTDGTVIHCIIKDCKADVHTNGGSGGNHDGDTSNGYRDYYNFAPMEYDLGQNMFQAQNSEVLEIFASSSGLNRFRSLYSMSGDSDSSRNHIAMIRMYKGKFFNSGSLRKDEVGSDVSYSVGNTTFAQGTQGGNGLGSAALGLTGSNLVDEWELTGMPVRNDLTANQMKIVLLGRDSLSLTEAEAVAIMGSNISLLKEAELLDIVRTSIVFTGLIVLLYGFLLMLAIIFDKANTFIDFSLVNILTFGKLHYDPFEEKTAMLPKGYISTKKLVIMSAITLLVGILLVSSGMTKLIGQLLYLITEHFS